MEAQSSWWPCQGQSTWLPSDSTPLADSCYVCGYRPPRVAFFALSGTLGNIFQLLVDRVLVRCLPRDTWWVPTVCWTVSYASSVALRLQVLLAHPLSPSVAAACLGRPQGPSLIVLHFPLPLFSPTSCSCLGRTRTAPPRA